MELEWDETKRKANIAKHGLDFTDIPTLDWDNATVLQDARKNYPEPRYWAFAMRRTRLYMVAFCMRCQQVRIISFRKANKKEVRRHGQQAK